MGLLGCMLISMVIFWGSEVRGQAPVTKPPVYNGDYIILAPNTVHPGLPLTLSVNILKADAGSVIVTANILKWGFRTAIVTGTKTFNGGSSGVIKLQMPSDATAGSYNLRVSGSGAGIMDFEESQSLTFKREGFAILVQSDKAIYKPGQTIMFRAMAVFPNLKPYLGKFNVEMKDPDGNIVKQWMDLQNTEYGVVSGEMFMSEEPRLGDWIIKVIANGQEYEHIVEVSEYVLPKFEVKFILPPYSTSSDKEIAGMVEAKYTYGQPVKGTATVTLTYNPGYTFWSSDGSQSQQSIVRQNIKVDGTGDIRFTKREIESAFDIKLDEIYDSVSLDFKAEVTETLTSVIQEGASSLRISKYPIKVSEVTGNPENFKPGLPYTAYVSVTHIDDSPLTEAERVRGVIVKVTSRVDYNDQSTSENIHDIPPSGIVKFGVVPSAGTTSYEIKVFYRDYAPTDPNSYFCNPCLSMSLSTAESPSNTFLQITTETTNLNAGDTARFSILTTEVPGTLQYQVVSRGDIIRTASIAATTEDTLLEFPVTSDMAPSPRLIAFYIRDVDGEVVLASINFKVAGVFENDVTISANKDKVEPGQEVSLDITAAANSFIGILAIDQSVRLLKTGNDITQDQVLEALDEFDTTSSGGSDYYGDYPRRGRRRRSAGDRSKRSIWCRWCWFPISGTTVKEVIDNAGLLVFTDGQVYENKDLYLPRHYMYFAAAGAGGGGTATGGLRPLEDAFEDIVYDVVDDNSQSASSNTRIRTEFPETWIWSNYVSDTSGNLRVTSKIPDTITSWVASAFGMSRIEGIGVADPTATIQVFKNFFISLNLPYSVTRGEMLALQVTVFNYMANDVTADITLMKSANFDNVVIAKPTPKENEVTPEKPAITYSYISADQVISAKIPANDGITVSFPIRPTKLGMVDLTVRADSNVAGDALTQPLLVKPEGVEQSYSKPVFVDLSVENPITLKFPYDIPTVANGLVDGSVRGVITATGDIMGPTIAGLDKLLKMPTGCGEQNMVYFAPDVFIYKYLDSTNQDNAAIKEKAIKFMEIGHSRELDYQHKDHPNTGSFSAFGDRDPSGSTWLTAFVVKSFVQASPYIYINLPKVEQALNWMLQQQDRRGVFLEPGKVLHSDMQGNVNSNMTMTAYVLISLQEVLRSSNISAEVKTRVQGASDRAVTYLESQKETIKANTYALALATYALTMANSAIKAEMRMALDAKAQGEGGVRFWSNGDGTTPAVEPSYYSRGPPSSDVEMTGYALLAYLETGTRDDFAAAAGPAKWLTQQRNAYGGYSSTQDTVIGLQALSEYASQLNDGARNIAISISSTSPADTQELTINQANSIVYQQVELDATSGEVTVVVTGTGNCLIQFIVDYNINRENIANNYDFTVDVSDTNRNRVDVKLCGRYVGEEEQGGMGILTMGVFSGFEAVQDDLKSLVTNSVNIARFESNTQGVTFYMNDVGTRTCATVPLQRVKPVANTMPVHASLYRYYAPDDQVTQIFVSETLANTNVCDVCGSNCNNCEDVPPGGAAVNVINSSLVIMLSALTLILHQFM